MKKRLFLLTLIISALLCLFAVTAYATEYEVTTADEFNSAFAEAVDGDTIVITASISATHDFGKSITYILDGDGIVWTAGAQCSAVGKSVSVLSKGGNNFFRPDSSMWCNSYSITEKDLSQTTWSFGAVDSNGTLTLDLVNTSGRLFYFENEKYVTKEFNLLPGTRVCNLNNTSTGSRFIAANTVNMYENVEIFGNKTADYGGLIWAQTFNMYGGKVYGNLFGCYGFAQVQNPNIYGGEIYENFQKGTGNSNVPSGIINSKAGSTYADLKIYNCKIENNLLLTTAPEKQSVLASTGSSHMFDKAVLTNYETSDWGNDPILVDGVYISEYDISLAEDDEILGKQNATLYDYYVIFKDSNSKLIAAYLVRNNGIKSTVDGATEVTVPAGYKWTDAFCYCVEVTPDTSKQGTYYVAVDHKTEDDHNCQTALTCKTCEVVIEEALEHIIDEIYEYQNGYLEKGIHKNGCTREGCEYGSTEALSPLFVNKGYTKSNDGSSFAYGISIDKDAIKLYEDATGITISYGIIVGQPNGDNGNIVDKNGKSLLDKSVIASFVDVKYNIYNVKLTDISTEEQRKMDIYCCAYVVDGTKVTYIGESETSSAVAINSNKIPVIDD